MRGNSTDKLKNLLGHTREFFHNFSTKLYGEKTLDKKFPTLKQIYDLILLLIDDSKEPNLCAFYTEAIYQLFLYIRYAYSIDWQNELTNTTIDRMMKQIRDMADITAFSMTPSQYIGSISRKIRTIDTALGRQIEMTVAAYPKNIMEILLNCKYDIRFSGQTFRGVKEARDVISQLSKTSSFEFILLNRLYGTGTDISCNFGLPSAGYQYNSPMSYKIEILQKKISREQSLSRKGELLKKMDRYVSRLRGDGLYSTVDFLDDKLIENAKKLVSCTRISDSGPPVIGRSPQESKETIPKSSIRDIEKLEDLLKEDIEEEDNVVIALSDASKSIILPLLIEGRLLMKYAELPDCMRQLLEFPIYYDAEEDIVPLLTLHKYPTSSEDRPIGELLGQRRKKTPYDSLIMSDKKQ